MAFVTFDSVHGLIVLISSFLIGSISISAWQSATILSRELNALKTRAQTLEDQVLQLQIHEKNFWDIDMGVDPEARLPNISTNELFPGLGTKATLDASILGPNLKGEGDGYDVVYPAVLAHGTVLVRGSGRVILDGDRSDLILKIDAEYFSLRELLDLGQGLDRAARPAPPPVNASAPLVASVCEGPEGCPWRRNWGLDGCMPLDGAGKAYACVCGGGWDLESRLVRIRHLTCSSSSGAVDATTCANHFYINREICCAPSIDLDPNPGAVPSAINGTCPSHPSDLSASNGAWIDVNYNCEDSAGLLCQQTDKDSFADAYRDCRPYMNSSWCLKKANHDINTQRTWLATRDYLYDDGNEYYVELGPGVTRTCLRQRLYVDPKLPPNPGFDNEMYAAWTCGDGTPVYLWAAPFDCMQFSESECFLRFSRYFGSSYEIVTPLEKGSRNKEWYCLSNPSNQTSSVYRDNQIVWRPRSSGTCLSFYLGNRTVGDETKSNPQLHLGIFTDDEFVSNVPISAEIALYAVDGFNPPRQ